MWWATLACLLVAVALVWLSLPEFGPKISIRFPEGHGLKPGDVMRHRGIDVGEVTQIDLSDDLAAIDVHVTLRPAAAALAREGSRFWIVRPQLSIEGIQGLETAVGAKYIGVSPGGPTTARQTRFEGLASAPPDELVHDGVEIVLRSDSRHGLMAGAPVTWRGVDVGQVLSVGLSPRAMHVDIHIRIDAAFRRLVNTNSKFWVTSGVGVDFRLTGVKLTAESLATIARGGVSFITPGSEDPVSTLVAGRVFTLHSEFNSSWMDEATPIALVDFSLPPSVTVSGTQTRPLLGIPRDVDFSHNGIILNGPSGPFLLTAADSFESTEEDLLRPITVTEPGIDGEFSWDSIPSSAVRRTESGLAQLTLSGLSVSAPRTAGAKIRVPTVPEECAVARSVATDDGPSAVMYAIGADRLTEQGAVWSFTDDETDLTEWHGSPVTAVSDGRVIGLLLVTDSGPVVAPCTESLSP
jgi:paraquat-inducible protein B